MRCVIAEGNRNKTTPKTGAPCSEALAPLHNRL